MIHYAGLQRCSGEPPLGETTVSLLNRINCGA
jgi:hypothetical protein